MSATTSRTRIRSSSQDAPSLKHAYSLQRSSPTRKKAFSSTSVGGENKRLQTIESGISLNEAAGSPDIINVIDAEKTSPDIRHELLQLQVPTSQSASPVIYPSSSGGNSPPTSMNLPPLHRNTSIPPPPLDIVAPKDFTSGNHQTKHSYSPSSNSYYSVDAGKHGFLSHTRLNGSFGSDSDDNGSVVFKYLPGEETPPAEYTLPATIMQVYGEEDPVVVDQLVLRRGASEQSNGSSISSTCIDGDGEVAASITNGIGNREKDNIDSNGKRSSQQQQLLPPPLPLLAAEDNSSPSSPEIRILPYQERKRLSQGPIGDGMKKNMQLHVQTQQQRKKKSTSRKEHNGKGFSGNAERQIASPLGNDDKESSSLLTSRQVVNFNNSTHYGAVSSQNGSSSSTSKDDHDDHQQIPKKTGWFGNLVTIVVGKDERTIIEEESKSYRDQARAFLEKTEEERMKLKEMSKMEELNQLTLPSYRGSFGHSRARMSSLTNALDSIASCSDDEDDETTDEESSSYGYDEDEESGTPIATNARVWKYGDRSVTSNARKISLRDERMKKERLIEEEYEYRLRALRHEHDRLAMRFRLFVLISVAFIFAGALAFALVVCIQMLFG
jgi:hypothetical protein